MRGLIYATIIFYGILAGFVIWDFYDVIPDDWEFWNYVYAQSVYSVPVDIEPVSVEAVMYFYSYFEDLKSDFNSGILPDFDFMYESKQVMGEYARVRHELGVDVAIDEKL